MHFHITGTFLCGRLCSRGWAPRWWSRLPPETSCSSDGIRHCVDDICVPVELYGHVLDLAGKCRPSFSSLGLVSVEKADVDTYTCPKLIGLPDMVKSSMEGIPPDARVRGRPPEPLDQVQREGGSPRRSARHRVRPAKSLARTPWRRRRPSTSASLAGSRPSKPLRRLLQTGTAAPRAIPRVERGGAAADMIET